MVKGQYEQVELLSILRRQVGVVFATLPDGRMPLEMGVDSRGILALLDALEADPAIEPTASLFSEAARALPKAIGRANPRSASALFGEQIVTGTALGLMIGEGRLSLDDW